LDCKVCQLPDAPEIVRRIKANEISIAEGAKLLGVSYRELWLHLKNCVVDKPRETSVDTLQLLEELLRILRQKLLELDRMEVSTANISALAKVADSLRKTCMDIERLTGKLRAAPLIQLQKITIHYENLLQIISTELCPECRRKVLKKLEAMTV